MGYLVDNRLPLFFPLVTLIDSISIIFLTRVLGFGWWVYGSGTLMNNELYESGFRVRLFQVYTCDAVNLHHNKLKTCYK